MSRITSARNTINYVANRSDKAILFYSAGKDSLTLLDLMAPYFKEIVLVYMYFVKDLDHVNKYLKWALDKYPNTTLLEVPHWNLTYILRGGFYCVPNPKVKLLKLGDVDRAVKLKTGIEYSFLGMKKADSLNRRLMMKDGGILGDKVYPLWEWTNKEVLAYMKARKLPQPVRYSDKASGGVGFSEECYLWMQKNAPNDLEKMLKAFPLSEKILIDAGIK